MDNAEFKQMAEQLTNILIRFSMEGVKVSYKMIDLTAQPELQSSSFVDYDTRNRTVKILVPTQLME